jgi:hypothetical protein
MLQLTNERSQTLKCSHYVPAVIPENTSLPCVVYCHGNRYVHLLSHAINASLLIILHTSNILSTTS